MLLALALACGETEDSGDSSPPVDPCAVADGTEDDTILEIEGLAECGEAVYATMCEACHFENEVDLVDHVPNHTDEALIYVLLAGSGDMPSIEIENHDAAHVLAWLRDQYGDYNGEGHQ
jgi:hypothetical protein